MTESLIKERFGLFLRAQLTRKKMSPAQLSELTGIDTSDLSRYENGRVMPNYERFIRINEALGLSPGKTFMKIAYGDK